MREKKYKGRSVSSTKRGQIFANDIGSMIIQFIGDWKHTDSSEVLSDIIYALILNMAASVKQAPYPEETLESVISNVSRIVTEA